MSNALQAIPTKYGLGVLTSTLKNTVTQYALWGATTHDTADIRVFYSSTIESSYFDDNGVLTFQLNLPIETNFKEYLHKIVVLDESDQVVIECATPKVALAKGIGGMVTLKAAVSGEAGEVVFKSSEFVTETELNELHITPLRMDLDTLATQTGRLEHLRGVPLDLDKNVARECGYIYRYFDSENGDNSNDGMTPATPWRDDSVLNRRVNGVDRVDSQEARILRALASVSHRLYFCYKTGEDYIITHTTNTLGMGVACQVTVTNYYYSESSMAYSAHTFYSPTFFPHIKQRVVSLGGKYINEHFSCFPVVSQTCTTISYIRMFTATTSGYEGGEGLYRRGFLCVSHLSNGYRFYRTFTYIGDNPLINQHNGGYVNYTKTLSFDQGNECYRGETHAHTVNHMITESYKPGHKIPFDIMSGGLSLKDGIQLFDGDMTNVRC